MGGGRGEGEGIVLSFSFFLKKMKNTGGYFFFFFLKKWKRQGGVFCLATHPFLNFFGQSRSGFIWTLEEPFFLKKKIKKKKNQKSKPNTHTYVCVGQAKAEEREGGLDREPWEGFPHPTKSRLNFSKKKSYAPPESMKKRSRTILARARGLGFLPQRALLLFLRTFFRPQVFCRPFFFYFFL